MTARREVIRLSLFFFLLYTADTSCNTIINYIFQELDLANIGPTSLAVQYLTLVISLIIAPGVKLKPKKQLLMGALLHVINYGFAIAASVTTDENLIFWLMCVGLGLGGFGSGFMWVSQGRYMHLVCQIFGANQIKGKLFGIFQLFYCLAMLCGALVTLFGIGYFSNTVYFTILSALGIAAFLYCLICIKNIEDIAVEELKTLRDCSSEDTLDRTERINRLLLDLRGFHEEKGYKVVDFLKKFFSFVPFMFCLIPTYLVEAVTTGIRLNQVTHLIPDSYSSDERDKAAGLCQIFAGIGSILGGYIASYLTDKLGTIWVGRLILSLFSCCCGVYILAVHQQSILLTYTSSFLWGFLLFSFVGLMMIIISRYYEGRAQAFAINRMMTAIFMMVFQSVMIGTHNAIDWHVYIIFGALSVPAIIALSKLTEVKLNDQQLKLDSSQRDI